MRNKEDEMVSKFAQDMSKQVNALTQERDQLRADLTIMTNRLRIARDEAAGLQEQRDTALAKVQELRDLIESMYGTMPPAHIKKWPNIMGRAKAEFQAAKNDRNERQK